MQHEQRMTTGSIEVGTLRVDTYRIRGEGGLLVPALVIPIDIELAQRPKEQQLALLRLDVDLIVGGVPGSGRLGSPVNPLTSAQSALLTQPTHPYKTQAESRFPLTHGMVRAIEESAHRLAASQRLGLVLMVTPVFGWVHNAENLPADPSAGQQQIGQALDYWPLAWNTQVRFEVNVALEEWVEIAKGLGLNEMRLVALRLPKKDDALDPQLVALYDQAVAKYEARDYRSAVALCRDIRHLVEKSLGASRGNPVASILASERGLALTDPPMKFMEDMWEAFAEATNDAHHLQTISPGVYAPPDVRTMLLFTGLLLEYLADSLRRKL